MLKFLLISTVVASSFSGLRAQYSLSDTTLAQHWVNKALEFENDYLWDSAAYNFNRALEVYDAVDDTLNIVKHNYYVSRVYMSLKKHDDVISNLTAVVNKHTDFFERNPWWKSTYYQKIGHAYGYLSNWIEARRTNEIAYNIYYESSLDDLPLLMKILANLSSINRYSFRYQDAAFYAMEQIKVSQEQPDELAFSYNRLGLAYSRLYNHEKSIEALMKCLKIRKEHSLPRIPFVMNNIALQYQRVKDYDSAQYWYSKALELCYETYDKEIVIHSALLGNMAYNYSLQGLYKKAAESMKLSIAIRKRYVKDEKLVEAMLQSLRLMTSANDIEGVKVMISKINEIIAEGNLAPASLALCYNEFGEYYLRIDNPSKALDYFNKALVTNRKNDSTAILSENFEDKYINEFTALKSTSGLIISLSKINKSSTGTKGHKDLMAYFEVINSSLSRYTGSQKEPFGLSRFLEGQASLRQSVLESAGLLHASTNDKQYILFIADLMESARMNLLKEQLRYEQQIHLKGLPDTLLIHRQELIAESYYHQQKTGDIDRVYEIDSEIYKIDEQLQTDAKEYHDLMIETDYNRLLKIKSQLARNEILIQYNFIGDKLYSLIHTNSTDLFKAIEWTQEDAQIIDDIQIAMKKNDINSINRLRHELSRIMKLEEVIPDGIDNITIIPDGKLSSIPFEMLPFGKEKYMLNKFAIKYASGLASFRNKAKDRNRDLSVLAFAPFTGNKANLIAHQTNGNDTERSLLSLLPASGDEVRKISKMLAGRFLEGTEASEDIFKKLAPKASIIHLATHSQLNDKNPLYNKILFAKSENEQEDGSLHTYELFNMELNADLVTLSACNTGVGKYYTGEGVLGLATGFKFSGVPNLLLSLWSVPDATTAKIMERFYFHLNSGLSKVDALRQAKLDYLKKADLNTSSPYYWAGFVLNSDISDNNEKRNSFSTYLIIILMIILFSLGPLMELRKKVA